VTLVTPFFAERYLLVEVQANGEHWTLRLSQDYNVHIGDTLRCAPNVEQILYFDGTNGVRIG
jgi:hypothetical protein